MASVPVWINHKHFPTRGLPWALAFLALATGVAVYVLDRDWASVLFLAPLADWQPGRVGLFGSFADSLPSFLHAYAFSLLLILAMLPSRAARWLGSLTWLVVATGLELLQAEPVKAVVARYAGALADAPLVGAIHSYIMFGRFDAADLVAAALGVFVALLTSFALEKQP